MKKGSWLVNTARGAIVVKEDVAEALKSGQLRGYGGDVWFPQSAPKDHPLRYATYGPFGQAATRPSPTCPVPRSTPRSATPPAPSLSSSPTSAASTTTGLRT